MVVEVWEEAEAGAVEAEAGEWDLEVLALVLVGTVYAQAAGLRFPTSPE